MEYVYVGRKDDPNIIADFKKDFEAKSLEALVTAYNKQASCGIVGVHMQALYLVALNQEFRERLKESPVYILEHVLGLVGPIELVDGAIRIADKKPF